MFINSIKEISIEFDWEVEKKDNVNEVRNEDLFDQLWLVDIPDESNEDSDRILNIKLRLGFFSQQANHIGGIILIEYPIEINRLNFDSPFDLAVLTISLQDLLS